MSIKGRKGVTTYVSSQYAGLPANSVFLSYRRESASQAATTLRFALASKLGDWVPFRDAESIPLGIDFHQAILEALRTCRAFLLLVDPTWATPAGRSRLASQGDYVRHEVEMALEKGAGFKLIPVLVDGAKPLERSDVPASLEAVTSIQALRISVDEHFESAIERLVACIVDPN